ncbi:MAG: prephenate dehydratase [Syntrophomonas sp.]|nr:prephenate dehydratase [Syntrophomonas sp.]
MKDRMAYLGPQATFCEKAALLCIDIDNCELIPCTSIAAVFAAIQLGKANHGIVPIENSCEGSLNQTLDLLAYEYDLKISGEIILPVQHNLLVRPGIELETISCVLSHPQALAQCRKYLSANLDDRECLEVASTAEAARRVADSPLPWASIGTAEAARSYDLAVLSPDIQDRTNNETRFITLSTSGDSSGSHMPFPKTSLLISLGNKPGALFRVLEQFHLYDINMTKIESRPAKTRIGDYLFFIDIEGHELEPRVMKALEGLKTLVYDLRVLGSYKSYRDSARQNGKY